MFTQSIQFGAIFPMSGSKESVKSLVGAMQAKAKELGVKTVVIPESGNHRVFNGNEERISNILYTGRDAEAIEPFLNAMDTYDRNERRYSFNLENALGPVPSLPAFEPTRSERAQYAEKMARYEKKLAVWQILNPAPTDLPPKLEDFPGAQVPAEADEYQDVAQLQATFESGRIDLSA